MPVERRPKTTKKLWTNQIRPQFNVAKHRLYTHISPKMKKLLVAWEQAFRKKFGVGPFEGAALTIYVSVCVGLVIIAHIAVLPILWAILKALLGLILICLFLYKIFSGFPAIFSALAQLVAASAIMGCIFSLATQHEAGGTLASSKIAELARMMHLPITVVESFFTPSGALSLLVFGIVLGVLSEACAGLVLSGFALLRMKEQHGLIQKELERIQEKMPRQ